MGSSDVTADHIKSHLQKFRKNIRSVKAQFEADYDRAFELAANNAAAAVRPRAVPDACACIIRLLEHVILHHLLCSAIWF